MIVRMKDRSFLVNLEKSDAHAYMNIICNLVLWHKQIRHTNFTNMKHMSSSDLVLDLPKIHEQSKVCEIYQVGKQAIFSFSNNLRVTEKLQFIHGDVCRPRSVPSLNGSIYFLLFLDDLTQIC